MVSDESKVQLSLSGGTVTPPQMATTLLSGIQCAPGNTSVRNDYPASGVYHDAGTGLKVECVFPLGTELVAERSERHGARHDLHVFASKQDLNSSYRHHRRCRWRRDPRGLDGAAIRGCDRELTL